MLGLRNNDSHEHRVSQKLQAVKLAMRFMPSQKFSLDTLTNQLTPASSAGVFFIALNI